MDQESSDDSIVARRVTPVDPQNVARRAKRRIWPWVLVVFVLATIAVCTQITIFVIQPIGAIPEGRTLIVKRQGKLQFIDSADAICERSMDKVSLLCRMGALATVANKSTIYARLPYSETLYVISTGGKKYEN